MTLYIVQGLPASGKSTYAEQMIEIKPSILVVSSDAIRFSCIPKGKNHESEVGDDGYSHLVNHCVWQIVKKNIRIGLGVNLDVILDATNLRRNFWKQYLDIAKDCRANTIGVMLKADLEDCIIRDAQRKRTVGESIIRQMHDGMDKFSDYKDDFNQIVTINYPKDIKSQDI